MLYITRVILKIWIGDLNKAKYYYDLDMKNTDFADLDILAERSGDFE